MTTQYENYEQIKAELDEARSDLVRAAACNDAMCEALGRLRDLVQMPTQGDGEVVDEVRRRFAAVREAVDGGARLPREQCRYTPADGYVTLGVHALESRALHAAKRFRAEVLGLSDASTEALVQIIVQEISRPSTLAPGVVEAIYTSRRRG